MQPKKKKIHNLPIKSIIIIIIIIEYVRFLLKITLIIN